MAEYILKRLLRSLLTLFIIVTIVFSLLRLMPIEGYFQNYEKMSSVQIELGLQELELDEPSPQQTSTSTATCSTETWAYPTSTAGMCVTKIIAEKVPVSMTIGLTSLAIALAVGLPMGVLMARSTRTKHKIGDKLGTAFIVLIQAVPAAVYYLIIQFYGTKISGTSHAGEQRKAGDLHPPHPLPGSGQYRLLCHVAAAVHGG